MVRNSLFNVGGYLITVVLTFLIAPITVHSLGDVRYGAWSLVGELVGYYGLLDLGIRGAVTYYVAKYSAQARRGDIRETVASAFWLLSISGLVAFLAGLLLTAVFPLLFTVDAAELREVRIALVIMSALIGVSLPMNALGGALTGLERFDICTSLEVANRVVTTVLVYVALRSGGGLVAMASIQAAGRLLSWAGTLAASRWVLGGVFVSPAWVRRDHVRALLSYGLRNAVSGVALLIIYRMDLTIVGMFAGLAQVTIYSMGGMLVSYAWNLASTITLTLTPRFTRMSSAGHDAELHTLFLNGMRIVGMIVTMMAAGLGVFGADFLRLWVGEHFVRGPWWNRSDVIMLILLAGNLPRMLQSISSQRLFAMARVRFLMWLNVGEAIANLTLSVVLARYLGGVGVAIGTLVPLLVTHVLIMPLYSSRTFDIPLPQLLGKGLGVPLLTGVLMVLVDIACIRLAPPTTWAIFFADVLVAVVLGTIVCVRVGLTYSERELLYRKISGYLGRRELAVSDS